MSAPAPFTVKTPLLSDAAPATPVLPTSVVAHPDEGLLAAVSDAVMETLSNRAVAAAVVEWLVTAKPTYAVLAIVNVFFPTTVQAVPSFETDAVITCPVRASFTHFGAVPVPPAVLSELPPVVVRR
jgi:hypothetical protein